MSPQTSSKNADPTAAQADDANLATDGKAPADNTIRVKDRRHASKNDGEAQKASTSASSDASASSDDRADDQAPRDPQAQAIAALEDKLAASENRLAATLAQYKDALDEFANVKARLKRDIGKEITQGKRSLLGDLLEVVDNLERAIEAAKPTAAPTDAFFQGVGMVRDQFLAKLEQMGVRRRQALHQPFDPDHFEAISTVPVTDAAQDGQVVGVVRDCYMLGDETLRYGMVAVGKLQG